MRVAVGVSQIKQSSGIVPTLLSLTVTGQLHAFAMTPASSCANVRARMEGVMSIATLMVAAPGLESSYFVGWGTLALINAGLAQGKNRSGINWFLASLLLGPLATLIIVVSDRKAQA